MDPSAKAAQTARLQAISFSVGCLVGNLLYRGLKMRQEFLIAFLITAFSGCVPNGASSVQNDLSEKHPAEETVTTILEGGDPSQAESSFFEDLKECIEHNSQTALIQLVYPPAREAWIRHEAEVMSMLERWHDYKPATRYIRETSIHAPDTDERWRAVTEGQKTSYKTLSRWILFFENAKQPAMEHIHLVTTTEGNVYLY